MVKSKTIEVQDGDILIMITDGILDCRDNIKKEWIEEFLKNINTTNVQKIADLIIAEAVDNNYGSVKDDMTVIVCKIIKRK